MRPTIGITCDTIQRESETSSRYMSPRAYARAVWAAGGNPLLLPHIVDAIDEQLHHCDGFVLTGGDDPDMTVFGQANHPQATIMDADRQRYELALVAALDRTAHPVLGICLGMQLMCLHHGGQMIQHLDDPALVVHRHADHAIRRTVDDPHTLPDRATVHSHHHQAISNADKLRVCAISDDGVIEAVDQPDAGRFYLGVQWHPERTAEPATGVRLFETLVAAAVTLAARNMK